ncbi:hypothetical protein ACLB2K_016470 [Fragaria x ananassa]
MRALYQDKKDELVAEMKPLAGGMLNQRTASKLLHLYCRFDSAKYASAILDGELGKVPPLVNELDEDSGRSQLHTAASAHAWRCMEALLKK